MSRWCASAYARRRLRQARAGKHWRWLPRHHAAGTPGATRKPVGSGKRQRARRRLYGRVVEAEAEQMTTRPRRARPGTSSRREERRRELAPFECGPSPYYSFSSFTTAQTLRLAHSAESRAVRKFSAKPEALSLAVSCGAGFLAAVLAVLRTAKKNELFLRFFLELLAQKPGFCSVFAQPARQSSAI